MKVNKQWLEDHGLTQEDIDEFRHPGPAIMGGVTLPEENEGEGTTPPPQPGPLDDLNRQITEGIDAFTAQLNISNDQFFNVDPASLTPEQQQQYQSILNSAGGNLDTLRNQLGDLSGQYGGLSGQLGAQSTQLGGLSGQLGAQSTQFGALGQQTGGQLGGIANTQLGISQGMDPRFAEFEAGQQRILEGQRQTGIRGLNTELARTGVRGTAAINERNRLNAGFDTRQQGLSGQIGMQQLQRQDAARSGAANLFGQRGGFLSGILGQQSGITGAQAGLVGQQSSLTGAQAGILGQQAGLVGQQAGMVGQQAGLGGLGFQSQGALADSQNTALRGRLEGVQTGLQNMLAAPTLQTAQLAANRSGGGGGGGKK